MVQGVLTVNGDEYRELLRRIDAVGNKVDILRDEVSAVRERLARAEANQDGAPCAAHEMRMNAHEERMQDIEAKLSQAVDLRKMLLGLVSILAPLAFLVVRSIAHGPR